MSSMTFTTPRYRSGRPRSVRRKTLTRSRSYSGSTDTLPPSTLWPRILPGSTTFSRSHSRCITPTEFSHSASICSGHHTPRIISAAASASTVPIAQKRVSFVGSDSPSSRCCAAPRSIRSSSSPFASSANTGRPSRVSNHPKTTSLTRRRSLPEAEACSNSDPSTPSTRLESSGFRSGDSTAPTTRQAAWTSHPSSWDSSSLRPTMGSPP